MPYAQPFGFFVVWSSEWHPWGVKIIKCHNVQFSSIFCYVLSPCPKFFLQHLILDHNRPIFFPYCETQSFRPVQNKMWITISTSITTRTWKGGDSSDKDSENTTDNWRSCFMCMFKWNTQFNFYLPKYVYFNESIMQKCNYRPNPYSGLRMEDMTIKKNP